ncbi:hypothetical protein DICA4_F34794 [Diutina catenulata]
MDEVKRASASVVLLAVLYSALSWAFPQSQLPFLAVVFFAASMLSRLGLGRKVAAAAAAVPVATGNAEFQALSGSTQREVISALKSLHNYSGGAKAINDRRRKLFKMMTWRQQQMCEQVGYTDKLNRIDQLAKKNQEFLAGVVRHGFDKYSLSFADFGYASDSLTSSSTYRVIEALSHFTRDWSQSTEIAPLVSYITRQLQKTIPESERADTCVVVPGSGLGRIAHEIASIPGGFQVKAVEFSGLMHICNQFVYSGEDQYNIFPYIHTCSNFPEPANQFRSETVSGTTQPPNLKLFIDDFRHFRIDDHQYKNVVVVSAFFIDTAENLMDYFDAITHFTSGPAKGYWINIGPLKYGSAPQVELTAQEIAAVRQKMGWIDLDYENTTEDLVGYITDKQSMWQGYYGLSRWTSVRE